MTVHLPKRVKSLYLNEIFFAIRRAIRVFDWPGRGVKAPISAPKQRHGGETLPARERDSKAPELATDSQGNGRGAMPAGHTKGRRLYDAL
jgi:hypothetical protein